MLLCELIQFSSTVTHFTTERKLFLGYRQDWKNKKYSIAVFNDHIKHR